MSPSTDPEVGLIPAEGNTPSSPPPTSRYPKRKRTEVNYHIVPDKSEASGYSSADSESEHVFVKRPRIQQRRATKPLPKRKIFPFLSLPPELRNHIYKMCLPSTVAVPATKGDTEGPDSGIFLAPKLKKYRRTVEYIPSYMNGDPESTYHHTDKKEKDEIPQSFAFNILATCKVIYNEAAPMFYGQPLIFTDADALFSFTAQLSPRTAKLLRKIEVRSWGMSQSRRTRGYMAMAMLAAKGVTDLDYLYINCQMASFWQSYWGNSKLETPVPKRIARKVYRDCHLWLEAVGTASGDPFRGVDMLKLSEKMFSRIRPRAGEDVENFEQKAMKMYRKELRRLLGEGSC